MSIVDRYKEQSLSLFRLVVGLLFACHGLASVFGLLGGSMGTGGSVPVGAWPGWWAALIQLVTGLLVFAGLGTRVAALLASGSMAYAYFTVHAEHSLFPIENKGEPAAMFCWAFLLIVFFGPGPWSFDRLIGRREVRTPQSAREGATV